MRHCRIRWGSVATTRHSSSAGSVSEFGRADSVERQPSQWLDAVRQVVAALQSSDVTELEIANGAFAVRIRREPRANAVVPQMEDRTNHAADQFHKVVAPLTGIFYRSPTPSAKPYVNEDEHVAA